MHLLNPYQHAVAGGVGYSAEASAYFALISDPGTTRKDHLATLIDGLKADGAFAKMLGAWLFCNPVDEPSVRVNLINPGTYTLSKINTPLWTADGGVNDNGGAGYYVTGIANSSLSQNDIGLGVSVLNTTKSANAVMGASTNTTLVACTAGDVFRFRVNQTANTDRSGLITTPKGISGIDRTASNVTQAYRAGSTLGTAGSTASATPASNNIMICTNNGTSFSGQTVGFAWAGAALGATLQAAVRSRLVTFFTAIGVSAE